MSRDSVSVNTINEFIGRLARAYDTRVAPDVVEVRYHTIYNVNVDFGVLAYPVDEALAPIARCISVSALNFAAAARARHPSVAAWTSSTRVDQVDPVRSYEVIRIDLAAMPRGTTLATALRATKSVKPRGIRVVL